MLGLVEAMLLAPGNKQLVGYLDGENWLSPSIYMAGWLRNLARLAAG